MLRKALISLLICLAAASCGRKAVKTAQPQVRTRQFPSVQAPRMITDQGEILSYIAAHFWDAYADTSAAWAEDSAYIAGVERISLEEQVGTYASLLSMVPMETAVTGIRNFYARISAFREKDPASKAFDETLGLVERYLYDENSPVRNEDIYGPLAQLLADSPYIAEELRPKYARDAGLCALNRVGTMAADFTFMDRTAREHSLYGIKAPWTLLFFSNPGCHNCAEVITGLNASQKIRNMVDGGMLAVVNVYIDEEVDEWRKHLDDYPSSWYNGYDFTHSVRGNTLYNVRAIPSLYVLDADKRVIMKDAPDDRVLAFIESIEE